MPRHNEKDLVDIPAEVKADLTLRFVDTLDDVVPRLFEGRPRATSTHPRALGKPAPALDGAKLGGRKKGSAGPRCPSRPARRERLERPTAAQRLGLAFKGRFA